MNRFQKLAWFQLGVVGIVAVASIILMALFVRKYEYEFLEAWWIGTGYSVPCIILTVLAPPVIFRKKKGQIDFDERDLMIDRQAMQVAFATTYAYFIAICMMTWVVTGLNNPIPAYWLARIVLGGWITSIVIHALTILIRYGCAGKGETS